MIKKSVIILFLLTQYLNISAQDPLFPDGKINFRLNESGDRYIRITFLNQVWLRYTELNPGSTVFGFPADETWDIGLRRTRLQLYGQLTEKVFFYTQFGQNNFSNLSPRFTGAFFHDAVIEYKAADQFLHIGGGLTAWTGLTRYSSPSIGSILSLDVPLYQQATNSVSDQFLRKLSIYAKGKAGKIDYRLAFSNPMAVQNSPSALDPVSRNAEFSPYPADFQTHGYFKYEFLDSEDNTLPYAQGTYLGTKRVFNIGAGFVHQSNAMWHTGNAGDTAFSDMLLLGIDIFYDAPVNAEKGNAITMYLSASSYDFGPGYMRNIGVMNPANGNQSPVNFNGAGNAFPMIGTGEIIYAQAGYLFKRDLLKGKGTLQPFVAAQYGSFERLKDDMLMMEGGINWYLQGTHGAVLSLNYQQRPVYTYNDNGSLVNSATKGMITLQYQVSL